MPNGDVSLGLGLGSGLGFGFGCSSFLGSGFGSGLGSSIFGSSFLISSSFLGSGSGSGAEAGGAQLHRGYAGDPEGAVSRRGTGTSDGDGYVPFLPHLDEAGGHSGECRSGRLLPG